jgi:hypothetical protein
VDTGVKGAGTMYRLFVVTGEVHSAMQKGTYKVALPPRQLPMCREEVRCTHSSEEVAER